MIRVLLILILFAAPAFAVEPDEVLQDPILENRAREISKGLRCPVCQNESIDESDAPIAKDLRLLVRERLVAGDDDAAVRSFIVDRYGEFVLFEPEFAGSSIVLWIAGPAMALAGLVIAGAFIRSRRKGEDLETAPLSEAEQAELDKILKD